MITNVLSAAVDSPRNVSTATLEKSEKSGMNSAVNSVRQSMSSVVGLTASLNNAVANKQNNSDKHGRLQQTNECHTYLARNSPLFYYCIILFTI